MEYNVIRRSLSSGSLVHCSRLSFKLRKTFLLFLSPLVITLQAQIANAANHPYLSYSPLELLGCKSESNPFDKDISGNDHGQHPIVQLNYLTNYLANQLIKGCSLDIFKNSIFCPPGVFDNISHVLESPNQALFTSLGILYIILAVNIAALLCIFRILTNANKESILSKDSLDALSISISQCISDCASNLSVQSKCIPVPNKDAELVKILSILNQLESLLSSQAIQSNSLGQEIAEFRQEFLPAIKQNLKSSINLESSIITSPKSPPSPLSHTYGDSPEYTDQDNYQYRSIVIAYRNALSRGDRSLLRKIYTQQLVITSESEEALLNSYSSPTRLVAVGSGGSYLLVPAIDRIEHAWILPDWRTLESFNNNRPSKGIFSYIIEANLCSAELRQPAEVRQVGDLWEVVAMGVIAVSG